MSDERLGPSDGPGCELPIGPAENQRNNASGRPACGDLGEELRPLYRGIGCGTVDFNIASLVVGE
jgi:hypothetical protein